MEEENRLEVCDHGILSALAPGPVTARADRRLTGGLFFFVVVVFLFDTVAVCDTFRVEERRRRDGGAPQREDPTRIKRTEIDQHSNDFVLGGYWSQQQASIAFLSQQQPASQHLAQL